MKNLIGIQILIQLFLKKLKIFTRKNPKRIAALIIRVLVSLRLLWVAVAHKRPQYTVA